MCHDTLNPVCIKGHAIYESWEQDNTFRCAQCYQLGEHRPVSTQVDYDEMGRTKHEVQETQAHDRLNDAAEHGFNRQCLSQFRCRCFN